MVSKVRLSKSGVSWTDYSWGVVDGCTKVSEACKNCYAEAMITRFHPGRKFTDVQIHPERLEAPLNTKKPGKIFVAPLGDLFHESVQWAFIDRVFRAMTNSIHTFQILTKRPDIMEAYFNSRIMHPLSNVWLGVTAENQEQWDIRTAILSRIRAAVRFVSIEPMLGAINFHSDCSCLREEKSFADLETGRIMPYGFSSRYSASITCPVCKGTGRRTHWLRNLHWVICGGESGPNARPIHPEWVRSLRDQCISASIPFYFKQWGEWFPNDSRYTDSIPVNKDFYQYFDRKHIEFEDTFMCKVGSKNSGCLLDGREWKQMPREN
jgi:protein gp37